MKSCSKCAEVKSFTEYHKRGDGYRSVCKICRFSERASNRTRAAKWYRSNHETAMASNNKWKEENKEKMTQYKNAWRKRNNKKSLAHWAVANALRSGRLTKLPCEVCENTKVHAHHKDYDKQLDINWLCDYHHKERHGFLINA